MEFFFRLFACVTMFFCAFCMIFLTGVVILKVLGGAF